MPELSELLTSASVKALHDAYQQGLLVIDSGSAGRTSPYLHINDLDTAGEPIARYMHYRLMRTAQYRPKEAPNPKFPYHATEEITPILNEQVLPWERNGPPRPLSNFSTAINRLLIGNGYAWRQVKAGRKVGGRAKLWLREWPAGVPLRWVPVNEDYHEVLTVKDKAREAKRIEEVGVAPVVVHVDVRNIAPPKGDAKSVLNWAMRFSKAAFAVQNELDESKRRITELEARVSELEQTPPPPDEWEEAATEIAALMSGGGAVDEGAESTP